MRYSILIVGLSIFGGYDFPLVSREYKSLDSATAGFEEIYFQLKKEGKIFLIDSNAVQVGMAASGGIYKWESDTLAIGNWQLKNDSVFCYVKFSEFHLDSLFSLNRNRLRGVRVSKNQVVFPENVDTLFIQGIPCVKL